MTKEYNVAILGATGAVGRRMIEQLAQSTIPVKSVKLLASSRSAGTVLKFRDQELTVEETTPKSFDGIDLVLSSAGGGVSKSSCQKQLNVERFVLIILVLLEWMKMYH